MSKKMIINADDFGLCSGVNTAIAEANAAGVLTSATIMANMDAVDEAIEISQNAPTLGVGMHLNVLEGKPLSKDDRAKPLIGEDGEFKYSASALAIRAMMSKKILTAIETELDAQIASIIDKGLTPTHLDSHKHFHCLPTVYKIVCSLAEKYNISAIRWPYEPATLCGKDWPNIELKDKVRAFLVRGMAEKCKKTDDRFIKTDIFFGLAHTGRINDAFWAELGRTQFAGIAETMTHPGYAEGLGKTRLVKERLSELKALCAPATKQYLADAGIELINYSNL